MKSSDPVWPKVELGARYLEHDNTDGHDYCTAIAAFQWLGLPVAYLYRINQEAYSSIQCPHDDTPPSFPSPVDNNQYGALSC